MGKRISTFLCDGFLDAGKTSYILHFLRTDEDTKKRKSLILACEEGEIEYEEGELSSLNASVRYLKTPAEWNSGVIDEYLREEKPSRVFVEMNGTWDLKALHFPKELDVKQSVLFVDATSFATYFANMRQWFTERMGVADVMCFTHAVDGAFLSPYKTALRLAKSTLGFLIVTKDYRLLEAFEEPLPYDVAKPEIRIEDADYATFYIDSYDHPERYDGKIIDVDMMAFDTDKLGADCLVVGRYIMNCCANDVQLYALPMLRKEGKTPGDRTWVNVKAKVFFRYNAQYQEQELIFDPLEVKPIAPKEEVLNLVGQVQPQ